MGAARIVVDERAAQGANQVDSEGEEPVQA